MMLGRWWAQAKDMLSDVAIELTSRRARTVLMILAVALSTGALSASLGISNTATRQIDADLAASTLNQIVVSLAAPSEAGSAVPEAPVEQFPSDIEERAMKVDLVKAAGRSLDLQSHATISRSKAQSSPGIGDARISVLGADASYVEAAGGRFDQEHRAWLLEADRSVVFLGHDAAKALDVPVSGSPVGFQVWIGDQRYDVVGFLSDGKGSRFSNAALIPYRRAVFIAGSDDLAQLLVLTAPGGGAPVAKVIRSAIRPDNPTALSSSQVVSVDSLRRGVENQMGRLVAGIGAFLLVLTALLIANSMIVSVVARTSEIGVRRALGASRGDIAATFLIEGTVIGAVGGLVGGAISVAVIVVVSAINGWSAQVDPWLLCVGPALGGVVGLVSSAYPAMRAARINPALAVRSD